MPEFSKISFLIKAIVSADYIKFKNKINKTDACLRVIR